MPPLQPKIEILHLTRDQAIKIGIEDKAVLKQLGDMRSYIAVLRDKTGKKVEKAEVMDAASERELTKIARERWSL